MIVLGILPALAHRSKVGGGTPSRRAASANVRYLASLSGDMAFLPRPQQGPAAALRHCNRLYLSRDRQRAGLPRGRRRRTGRAVNARRREGFGAVGHVDAPHHVIGPSSTPGSVPYACSFPDCACASSGRGGPWPTRVRYTDERPGRGLSRHDGAVGGCFAMTSLTHPPVPACTPDVGVDAAAGERSGRATSTLRLPHKRPPEPL